MNLARGDFSCEKCGISFDNRTKLTKHIERHEYEVNLTLLHDEQILKYFPIIIQIYSISDRIESETGKSRGHKVTYHSMEVITDNTNI